MDDQHDSTEALRSELTRLKDREATLSHLLTLERERRVRAEHLFEVERLACFQLGHQLAEHKAVLAETRNIDGCSGENNSSEKTDSPADSKESHGSKAPTKLASDQIEPVSKMNDSLCPLSVEEDDFASSIFNQLPPDLQQVLGVSDTQETENKEALFKATAAVLANNPDELRKHSSLSALQASKGKSLLETSCENGYEGCVRVLLEAHWSPGERTAHKQTPLHICAKHGHLNSLKVLLEFRADPNLKDDHDQIPLHLALRHGHENAAQCLLQAGSSLTAVTRDGLTALHIAIIGSLPHALRLLITHLQASLEESQFKAFLNYPDTSGSTPLHTAVSRGQAESVGVLCACEGVGVSSRDRWNRTPMDVAVDDECRDLLRNRECRGVLVVVEHSPHKTLGIGQLSVLPHHRLSDTEFLVADLLSQYSRRLPTLSVLLTPSEKVDQDNARAFTFETSGSVSDRVQRECGLADALKDVSTRGKQYLQYGSSCVRSVCEQVTPLGLVEDSVAGYQVGALRWRRGELNGGVGAKSLLSVLTETQPEQIKITLKGSDSGSLDELAFDSMIPVVKLQEYIHLIEQNKALVIHGPQGSGKTHLARALASYIKATKKNTQVVYSSLHPTFQRDDFFRLLHVNGLLSQQKRSAKQSYVVILDDLSSIQAPSVLAELLTSLEYRGAEMWVNEVYGRDGSLLYPCGHYYLTDSAHFITTSSSETSPGSDWVDQFAHVSLDLPFSSGVLVRHLSAHLIHVTRELSPSPTLPLSRMVRWVIHVWVLYNNFVRRIGLQKLAVGVRHFIQCPVESGKPEAISSWLVSLWTHHLAPAIRSVLLTPSSPKKTVQDYRLVSQCLSACVRVVFESCCPLSYEGREKCMKQLREAIESSEAGQRWEKEDTVAQKENDAPVRSAQHPASSPTGSPSMPLPATKPPLPPQTGSMVSYEDMVRDSPRNKSKHHSNDAELKQNSTMSGDSIPQDNKDSKPTSVDKSVTLRPKTRKGTLRKIRAKTISLFSKDSGTPTLPRFFKKGQKSTINPSATSDDLRFSHVNSAKEAKQFENMLDLLTSANSRQFKDQRIPSPPPRAVSVYVEDKHEKERDLDDFLDVLSSMGTSRIDEQRSPLKCSPSKTVSPKKSKKMKSIPRYTLPTEPPLREEHLQFPNKPSSSYRDSSPVPVYSSATDIPSEVENQSSIPVVTTQPVHRKSLVASVLSYDSVFNDDQSSSSCYSASVTEEMYPQQDSPQSEPGFKHPFRKRANTYDDNCVISEPLRRRKTPLKRNTVHPHSPTNSALVNNIRSPASPLTKATYSSPRGSPLNVQQTLPVGFQLTSPSDKQMRPHVEKLHTAKLKASSVANIAETDELGDFDLFRAASDGDLLQSSKNDDSVFDFSSTNTYKDTDTYTDTNQNYLQQNRNKKSSNQSNTSEYSPSENDSQKHHSPRTSSDKYPTVNKLKRQRSSTGGIQSSHQYASDRRFSEQSDQKNAAPSPLRRSSENSAKGPIGANLLYSASLGFDSLPRLSSSRDRLSSIQGELTEM